MAKGGYLGVSSKAKKIKKIYIGVGGKAKKVKKAYIGVGGKAKLFFSSGLDTNKMLLMANNGNSSNTNCYELNTDTGVLTLKSSDVARISSPYSSRYYDSSNNRFICCGYVTNDFGATWTQMSGYGRNAQLGYKGHVLYLFTNDTSTQSLNSGTYLNIDGTNVYLGQDHYVSGGYGSATSITPYSETEVLCLMTESWTYPSTHQNYRTYAWLVNVETHEVKNVRTTYNPSPYEFGGQAQIQAYPSLTDVSKGRFIVKYRNTHQNDDETNYHLALAYISVEDGNYVMRKVPNSTPTSAVVQGSQYEIFLGRGARTEERIVLLQMNYYANYYLSTDEGNTWTVVTPPSITQGNRFANVYSTGEKFIALIGPLNNSVIYVNGIMKSTNGSTWTLVTDVPNRQNIYADANVYGLFPILIGSYYRYQE